MTEITTRDPYEPNTDEYERHLADDNGTCHIAQDFVWNPRLDDEVLSAQKHFEVPAADPSFGAKWYVWTVKLNGKFDRVPDTVASIIAHHGLVIDDVYTSADGDTVVEARTSDDVDY